MHRRALTLFCALGLGCAMVSQARATAAIPTVSFSYVTDSTSYTGTPGSTVPVNIYLQETLTGGATDIVTPDGGLLGAGAGVNATGTTGGTSASFTSGAFTEPSPPWGSTSAFYNQGGGSNLEFVNLAPFGGPYPDLTTDLTGDDILLGTLDITVGTGTTTYLLTSLNDDTINGSDSQLGQTDGNTVDDSGADLDAGGIGFTGADAAAGESFTVVPTPSVGSPVPLPASLWLGLTGLGGLVAIRWISRVRGVAGLI
jgi:hypothetical protein